MARLDSLIYYINNRSPAIVRKISEQDGGTFDIATGQSFRLRVRPKDSETIILDKTMTPDVVADTLTYAPVAGDFDEEGVFRAWIVVTFPGAITQDTDEFEIVVLTHAPGVGVRVGAVANATRAQAPIVWDSLRAVREYGDRELQRQVDLAKLRVLKVAIPASDEVALDPRVVDYIAKKVLVDSLLNAARDYWTNQLISQTALGNATEVKTYPDRISAVERLQKDLAAQLAAQTAEVTGLIGSPGVVGGGIEMVDGGDVPATTIDDVILTTGEPCRVLGLWSPFS
jgi:hypothetical protein